MMKKRVALITATNEKVWKQIHIHHDIAFSILSKVSIKSMKRFECVCKSWSYLFDNPCFMTMYRNYFLTKDHSYYDDTSLLLHQTLNYFDKQYELYVVSGERFRNRVKLDWPNPFSGYNFGFNIIGSGSVHGIFCLLQTSRSTIILWNPFTKEVKVIPKSPLDCIPNKKFLDNYRGFGYDHVKDDYKVMRHRTVEKGSWSWEWFRIYYPGIDYAKDDYKVMDYGTLGELSLIWEIYSLRSNSWRKLDVDMHHQNHAMDDEQVYMDGLSHWVTRSDMHTGAYLLSFNWSSEIFLTTPIPSNMQQSVHSLIMRRNLMLLNGSIALIFNDKETSTFRISILGELGVKESWTKLFIIGPLICLESFSAAGKKGDMLFNNKAGGQVWLDLNTQMIEDIGGKYHGNIIIHKEKRSLLPCGLQKLHI